MMSDVRYEIKTSLPVIWLENIDTKNPGLSVRNELTMTKLILVDPVEDEDVEETCPRTDPPNVLQCDLKKIKKRYHSSDRSIITLLLLRQFKHLSTN